MIPSDTIDEFVRRARAADEPNIENITLFGSAVAGDFHAGFSNVNLLCILRDTSLRALRLLTPVAKWWDRKKQPPPLCMTRQELERSTDVFTIELLDMQQHHRVLFGEDVLQGLRISMDLHRVQVEYELREKLILLREHLLLSADSESRLWELLMRSAPSFSTLFRHALIALGETTQAARPEAFAALSRRTGFDPSAMLSVLEARQHKAERKKIDVYDLAARYLAGVEKVAAAVDMALDSESSGRK
jgi:hypothetical protein